MRKNHTFFPIKDLFHHTDIWFVSFSTFLFSLLRLPSLIEPYWYGDEGIYQVVGMAMARGRLLYKEIWDNKPPFLYLIYSLFDGDLFYVKLASLIFGALSILVFFALSNKLFKNKKSIYISTIIFALLFGLPLIEGNIANAENFMLLPIVTSFYLVLSSSREKSVKFIMAGILLSIAFLFKTVALFDLFALLTFMVVVKHYEAFAYTIQTKHLFNIKKIKLILGKFREEVIVFSSFTLPILLVVLFFMAKRVLPDLYSAAFSQNVPYVGYSNYFLFPMGFLFIKMVILVFSILLIVRYRKNIGVSASLIFIWLAFSIFNAFFSERPYTHYLLVLLPSFALLIGFIFDNKKTAKLSLFLLTVFLFLIFKNFNIYKKIDSYYINYANFIKGNKSIEDYQRFFDKNTPRDYELASFISMKARNSDAIFIWSDSGQIYALSNRLPPGRYIVAYHITSYKAAIDETKRDLNIAKPRYIIQTKNSPEIKNFLEHYTLIYTIGGAKIYERKS